MKLSDYVSEFLSEQGITHVFGVTGGAVVHLFDSCQNHPKLTPIFCHHEQAASLAAVSYARMVNHFGAAIVTTGPGGTNALTGLVGAWQDSIPCFFISGQSRSVHLSRGKPVRQVSPQELDIVTIVQPMTKYAAQVMKPEDVRYELEKARYMALEGRPGPVWVDIPVDFQWLQIEPSELRSFDPTELESKKPKLDSVPDAVQQCVELLKNAKRPLLLCGYGIRLAHAEEEFQELVKQSGLPFASTWMGADYLPTDHPAYVGRMGFFGQRGGNMAIQNCDLLLAIGTHLAVSQTGTLFDAFAREAKVIVVDIDRDQLEHSTVHVDVPVVCDAKEFLGALVPALPKTYACEDTWRALCGRYKKLNEVSKELAETKDTLNSYVCVDTLCDHLNEKDLIVVDGGGTALYAGFQASKLRRGQRLLLSSSICAMGTALPEAVGACFASGGRRTSCIIGDGSLQFNIHELQTIVHHRLPIKIFVINNEGYLAMRHTQGPFLGGRYVGSTVEGGISCPDTLKIAAAYEIPAVRVKNLDEFKAQVNKILRSEGPYICEVIAPPDMVMQPSQAFEQNPNGTFRPLPLEDMNPRLPRELYNELMVVKPYEPK